MAGQHALILRRFCLVYLAYLAICYGADYLLRQYSDVSVFELLCFLAVIEALRFTARGTDWGAVGDISSLGHWKLAAYTAGFILLARLALAVLEKLVFHGGQDLGHHTLQQGLVFLGIGAVFWTLLIRLLFPWLVKRARRNSQIERQVRSKTD